METKVYVTKYALTKGIQERVMNVVKLDFDDNIYYARALESFDWTSFRIGTEAFLTKEEAIKKAEKMRIRKIKSLKKQIEKLDKLKFE